MTEELGLKNKQQKRATYLRRALQKHNAKLKKNPKMLARLT